MRRILTVVTVVVVTLGLVGCDQFLPEPLSFTMVDSVPVVRTCIPLTITTQSIVQYSGEEDYEGHVVWHASGFAKVDSGTEFAIGQPIPGLSAPAPLDPTVLTGEYGFEMHVDAGRGGDWTTFAHFDAAELADGVWLDSYGTPQATPCTHEECMPAAACFNDWPQPSGRETEAIPTFTPVPSATPTVEP